MKKEKPKFRLKIGKNNESFSMATRVEAEQMRVTLAKQAQAREALNFLIDQNADVLLEFIPYLQSCLKIEARRVELQRIVTTLYIALFFALVINLMEVLVIDGAGKNIPTPLFLISLFKVIELKLSHLQNNNIRTEVKAVNSKLEKLGFTIVTETLTFQEVYETILEKLEPVQKEMSQRIANLSDDNTVIEDTADSELDDQERNNLSLNG